MAFKQYQLDDFTSVTVYKRVGSRNLRLSVTSTGLIRVTIPAWSPYVAGLHFARARIDWIRRQQPAVIALIPGQEIGKAHHLLFVAQTKSQRVSSRVRAGDIVIGYPIHLLPDDAEVQAIARAACIRALRKQAEQLLPQRLTSLAVEHGFTYNSVSIKQLKSRWGSCDQSQNIVLNLYLMQLPWALIEYVLIHELIHTRVLHHGPDFWQAFEAVLPGAKRLRTQMRLHQPLLYGAVANN